MQSFILESLFQQSDRFHLQFIFISCKILPCKIGYRRLARQLRTCFMTVSQKKKITPHENYLHTFLSSYYFLIKYFLVRKSLWFHNFTTSSAKWFEVRYTRNLSREVTISTRINLYRCFISGMFSCCQHISQTSHEASVDGLMLFCQNTHFLIYIATRWLKTIDLIVTRPLIAHLSLYTRVKPTCDKKIGIMGLVVYIFNQWAFNYRTRGSWFKPPRPFDF